MAITLDPATEQRIQRELDRGHYASPDEVIAQALDHLQVEEDWLTRSRRPLTPERIDTALALVTREGTQPPVPGDEIPQAYKAWEREQAPKTRRKAG